MVIPKNWKQYFPFSERFVELGEKSDSPRIDLATTSFYSAPLVTGDKTSERSFAAPDSSAFAAELIYSPYSRGERELFLVQAESPALLATLLRDLGDLGIEVLEYIPQQAYLVRLDSAQKAAVETLPSLYWLGFFQPAWKIAPDLDFVIESDPDRRLSMVAELDRAVFPTVDSVVDAFEALALVPSDVVAGGDTWWVELATEALRAREVAALYGTRFVLRTTEATLSNNVARTSAAIATGRGAVPGPVMDVEDVWARGLLGTGQIAAIYDSGVSTGNLATLHRDFGQQGSGTNPQRVLKGYGVGRTNPERWDDDGAIGGGHGTHVLGILAGNGFRSGSQPHLDFFPPSSYAGIAPKAQIVVQSAMTVTGGFFVPTLLEGILQPPYDDGARVHSNSWRVTGTGGYDARAQSADRFIWNHPDLVMVVGAGNEGRDVLIPRDGVIDPDRIGSPSVSKNVITVGATESFRNNFVLGRPVGDPPFGLDCTSIDGVEQRTWGWYSAEFNLFRYDEEPLGSDLLADHASGMTPFSSRGPANDDRIKPDLVAPGGFIVSTRTDLNANPFEHAGDCGIPSSLKPFYLFKEGTSMSTPMVAGAAVLTRQYYADGWHANGSKETNATPIPGQGFDPTAALVKATLINGAWDITPGQYGTGASQEVPPVWDTGFDLPNNVTGYGRVDLEATLFPGAGFGHDPERKMQIFDVGAGLATGGADDYNLVLSTGADGSTDPLYLTLVWTDPEGSVSSGPDLVNDLDLEVTAPDGTVYFSNGIDRVTGGPDRVNNVEQVRVTAAQAGAWSVRVVGWNVPGNGQAGTTTQPYALVMSGSLADNAPPTPMDDSFSTPEDTELVIPFGTLLANDSDPDGDGLSVVGWTQTTNGTLSPVGSTGLRYRPDDNFHGTDSFTYTVSDGSLTATADVTITVTPVNDPPTAVDDSFAGVEDTDLVLSYASLLANDSDVDEDALQIVAFGQPARGILLQAPGQVTYRPDPDSFGSDSFTYTVSDGSLTDTATVFLDIAPVNDPPLAVDDSFSLPQDTDLVLAHGDLLGNDSDIENDPLSIVGFGPASHGTVIAGSGEVTYRPDPGFFGSDSFTYTLSDGDLTATGSVLVTVLDTTPPVPDFVFLCLGLQVDFDASGSTDNDQIARYVWTFGDGSDPVTTTVPTVSYTYGASGVYSVTLEVVDRSENAATLTLSVTADGTPPVAVITDPPSCQLLTCSFDGSGSSDDLGIAAYAWDFGDGSGGSGETAGHTYGAPGTYTVVLTVTDLKGNVGTDTLTFTPDLPPVASFVFGCNHLTCGFDAAASSDDFGIVSYAWDFGDGTTSSGVEAAHGYVRDGVYSVTLTVTDGSGQTHSSTQTVRVVDDETFLKLHVLCD